MSREIESNSPLALPESPSWVPVMIEPQFSLPPQTSIPDAELLEHDEVLLIVDDFSDIAQLIKEFLEVSGFPAVSAGSAEELRHALATRDVALIVLDIGLPDGDGMQLLPELKKDHADLGVIMLTAVTDLQTALVCLRYGADDYLTKPVQFTELLATVRKVLEKRRLTIRNRRYQKQIEQANFRIQLSHQLAMRMNSAYLSMVELDDMTPFCSASPPRRACNSTGPFSPCSTNRGPCSKAVLPSGQAGVAIRWNRSGRVMGLAQGCLSRTGKQTVLSRP